MGDSTHSFTTHRHGAVCSQFLYRAYRSCQKLGARQPVLLDALQLEEADLRNPQNRFDDNAIRLLCEAASGELKQDHIASQIGRGMVPSGFSDNGYFAMFEKTYGRALQATLEAQGWGQDHLPLKLVENGESYRLVWGKLPKPSPEFVEMVFSLIFFNGQALMLSRLPTVERMGFAHPEPDGFVEFPLDPEGKNRVSCSFNETESYIEFPDRLINMRNPHANFPLVRAARRQAKSFQCETGDRRPLTKLVYGYLAYLLDKSGLSLESAADSFGMAERTLRRKLVAEGTSFRQILEQVRRDTCQLYFLEGSLPLAAVASKLGYSELSAFTRAYSAWYGHPPSKHDQFSMAQAA